MEEKVLAFSKTWPRKWGFTCSHAYNKGSDCVLVVSRVPLPNYRADLDEMHGSSQRKIQMSTAIEGKLEHMLEHTKDSDCSKTLIERLNQTQSKQILSPGLQKYNSDMRRLSLDLRSRQQEMKAGSSVKAMLSFREKLPAYKMKHEFLQAVANNQVLVVSGETGCGKTTQLPQFILDDQIESLNGAHCNIICTQPRRISAVSVATRVSSERGEDLGETIGYQIRLESERSAQTHLLFCTTGILLRRLVREPELKGVTHVFVDEIHERGMNEDFLVIILRDLLPRRPDLRLVLMSATINADFFSKYFGNAPMMHIPGFTFPVKELFLEDIFETMDYAIVSEFDSSQYNSRSRRRQQEKNKDPLLELFELQRQKLAVRIWEKHGTIPRNMTPSEMWHVNNWACGTFINGSPSPEMWQHFGIGLFSVVSLNHVVTPPKWLYITLSLIQDRHQG